MFSGGGAQSPQTIQSSNGTGTSPGAAPVAPAVDRRAAFAVSESPSLNDAVGDALMRDETQDTPENMVVKHRNALLNMHMHIPVSNAAPATATAPGTHPGHHLHPHGVATAPLPPPAPAPSVPNTLSSRSTDSLQSDGSLDSNTGLSGLSGARGKKRDRTSNSNLMSNHGEQEQQRVNYIPPRSGQQQVPKGDSTNSGTGNGAGSGSGSGKSSEGDDGSGISVVDTVFNIVKGGFNPFG
jgi:hypothetical protein